MTVPQGEQQFSCLNASALDALLLFLQTLCDFGVSPTVALPNEEEALFEEVCPFLRCPLCVCGAVLG